MHNYLKVYDVVPIGIFAINDKYEIIYWNRAIENLSNIKRDDILGSNLFKKFPRLESPLYKTRIRDIFENKTPQIFSALLHKYIIPCEFDIQRFRIQHTTGTPYQNEEDDDCIAIFSIQDVTDETIQIQKQKEMKERALNLVNEVKKAEEKLKESEKKLKSTNANKDKFFSILAHDLRGPFSTLTGFSEMLYDDFDEFETDQIKQYIKEIFQTSSNTYDLLQNLLEWAKLNTNNLRVEKRVVNLSNIVNTTFNLLGSYANEKGINLKNNVDLDIHVDIDENMIYTVIRNLVSNAIKFTNKGDWVTINADIEDKYVTVSVEDTGVGMTEEIKNNLFRIEVSHTEKGTNDEEGTGLGLILCDELVNKHNSKICVESEINVGSKFYFNLSLPS